MLRLDYSSHTTIPFQLQIENNHSRIENKQIQTEKNYFKLRINIFMLKIINLKFRTNLLNFNVIQYLIIFNPLMSPLTLLSLLCSLILVIIVPVNLHGLVFMNSQVEID